MRFLGHQAKARWQIARLILLYIVLMGLVAHALAWLLCVGYACLQKSLQFVINQPLLIWATVGIAAFMVLCAIVDYVQMSRSGGSSVVQRLGGRSIDPSADTKEAQLCNIVDEMVVAAGSGCPRPLLYVLDDETSINAITDGASSTHFAMAVTSGALQLLNREELQALVAHEMGHVLENDETFVHLLSAMTQSLRGLQTLGKGLTVRHDFRVWLVAALLWLLGGLGAIAGRILQFAVSREREFLADARATQFTRNPQSLVGVLSKIAVQNRVSPDDAWFTNRQALPVGHAFFNSIYAHDGQGSAWLDTHPSLASRIARLRQM